MAHVVYPVTKISTVKNINDTMKAHEMILAALGGAVVGAAAALLFAPEKGSKTRKNIKEFIKDNCPFVKESEVEQLADRIEAAIETEKTKTK